MKKEKLLSVILAAAILCLTVSGIAAPAAYAEEEGKWVATWSTSLVDASITISNAAFQDFIPANSTIRTEIAVTTAGTKLQFVFSNQYGQYPITINEASLARTDGRYQAKIKAGTQVPLSFNGQKKVTIPAGGRVTSDVIDYETKALERLSISLFIEDITYIQTAGLSNGRTYLNAGGIFLGKSKINDLELPNSNEISLGSGTIIYHTIPFLEEIDSFSPDVNASCAVFIGDSTLVNDTYLYYATRIASTGCQNIGVINKAIIGNKLLSDGSGMIGKLYGQALIERFKRDVLDVAGVKFCFVKIGLNDILHQYSASLAGATPKYTTDQIIAGYKTLVNLAHENGIKIYFFTKSAWKGYARSFLGQTNDLEWNSEAQEKCDVLSKWALENNVADGKIDCSPLADPSDPLQLCPSFTPDGAHLTDLGSIALADLIPLEYVGLSSSAGKTAAAITKTNPYAEKEQIIKRMNEPTTAEPTTTKPQEQVTQPTQTAPTTPSQPASQPVSTVIIQQPATAYAYVEPQSGVQPSSYPYIEPSVKNEPASTPANQDSNELAGQNVNYNIDDDLSDVTSIGSGAPIGFILILLLVIMVAAAAVILSIGRKQEEY